MITGETTPEIDDLAAKLIAEIAKRPEIQVVAFGENHIEPNNFRKLLQAILPGLKELGFGNLGLEIFYAYQFFLDKNFRSVERWKKGIEKSIGNRMCAFDPAANRIAVSDDFYSLLALAKELGYRLIAIDDRSSKDQRLARTDLEAARILLEKRDPDAKTVLLYGSLHLARYKEIEQHSITSVLEKHGLSVFSILHVKNSEKQYPGIAFPLIKAPQLLLKSELTDLALDSCLDNIPAVLYGDPPKRKVFVKDFDASFWAPEPLVSSD